LWAKHTGSEPASNHATGSATVLRLCSLAKGLHHQRAEPAGVSPVAHPMLRLCNRTRACNSKTSHSIWQHVIHGKVAHSGTAESWVQPLAKVGNGPQIASWQLAMTKQSKPGGGCLIPRLNTVLLFVLPQGKKKTFREHALERCNARQVHSQLVLVCAGCTASHRDDHGHTHVPCTPLLFPLLGVHCLLGRKRAYPQRSRVPG
jgi:hypothetical protein